MTTSLTAEQLPEGYYATIDPAHPDQLCIWRRHTHKGVSPRLTLDRASRLRATNAHGWLDAALAALLADPVAARRRYATTQVRCHLCGRKLTDPVSRQAGIGPDCAAGLAADLADLFQAPERSDR